VVREYFPRLEEPPLSDACLTLSEVLGGNV
jgi:hypothetical protein